MDIINQLIAELGEEIVWTGEVVAERSAGVWDNPGNVKAKALVRPSTTEEVAATLRICNEAGQAVVPHGGLTNVVRSSISNENEVVLSLEKMNRIIEIDEVGRTATVEAGVVLLNLQNAVAEKGLLFPLDLGAKGSCQIGGNISTNAGGLRVLRYGMTRSLVLGLEVVLADGTVLSSLGKVIKDNAGYDWKQNFIGTEGTLGIVTKAVLKLEEAPQSKNTAFVALDSFEKVQQFLKFADRSLAGTLSAFELIWKNYYDLMTTEPSSYAPPLPSEFPFYVLMEALGSDQEKDSERFQMMLETAFEKELIADAAIAYTDSDLAWFWGIRESVDLILSIKNPVFLFDISLPIIEMDTYTKALQASLDEVWEENDCYIFGHMYDGNLHLFISCGAADEATRHQVEGLVYQPLQKLKGSISAEHGIGLEKKNWLHLSRSVSEINFMKTLKNTLDPKGILNPSKIF